MATFPAIGSTASFPNFPGCAVGASLRRRREGMLRLFAIRIESTVRRHYSFNALPGIDGLALNTEILRLVILFGCVREGH